MPGKGENPTIGLESGNAAGGPASLGRCQDATDRQALHGVNDIQGNHILNRHMLFPLILPEMRQDMG